jgi:GNAT superfamily N-acetyltransferase
VIVRAARDADIAAMTAILEANDEPVSWPDVPRAPYVDHLLTRPRTRVVVAEHDGSVVGLAASIEYGTSDCRFLSDLYVHPAQQSGGIGSALLREVLAGTRERMTFSSKDPRALASYIRSGMRPWWPLLYMEVGEDGLGPHEAGVTSRPADVTETARISQDWTGIDRTADFSFYARLPDAAGVAVLIDDEVAAVGWARRELAAPGRWLDHASFAPGADPIRAAFGILRAASDGQRLGAAVPGPHPAVAALFEHGVRFDGSDTFCATDRDLIDPALLFPSPGML